MSAGRRLLRTLSSALIALAACLLVMVTWVAVMNPYYVWPEPDYPSTEWIPIGSEFSLTFVGRTCASYECNARFTAGVFDVGEVCAVFDSLVQAVEDMAGAEAHFFAPCGQEPWDEPPNASVFKGRTDWWVRVESPSAGKSEVLVSLGDLGP